MTWLAVYYRDMEPIRIKRLTVCVGRDLLGCIHPAEERSTLCRMCNDILMSRSVREQWSPRRSIDEIRIAPPNEPKRKRKKNSRRPKYE